MNKGKITFTLLIFILLATSCTKVKYTYFQNGRMATEMHYRFGKETGTTIYNHEKYPYAAMEIEMKKGMRNGKFIKRYFNNSLEITAFYKNDKLEGVETMFYQDGQIMSQINYVNGVKNGAAISWFSNGVISAQGSFVNDLWDGLWEHFDERGCLIREGNFVVGSGNQFTYDSFGKLISETNYVNNTKDGLETQYSFSGEIEKTILFKKDRIIEINGKPIQTN